jgi:hypothetical protein
MLSAYYRLVFAWRGKRVTRLKFFESRSKVFKRSLDALVQAKHLQDGRKGETLRKITRAILLCGWTSSALLLAWMVWESRWVFEIYR